MPILDYTIFAEFRATLGQESAVIWIEKFLETLDLVSLGRDPGEADRDQVFETAHLVVVRAGLIGCCCLVDACVELQRSCKTGEDFLKPYAAMKAAAAVTGSTLRNAL